ncbi:MAG: AI-2E family transporter, partial [Candidatus Levyibacteriota bacterium]
MPSTPTRIDQTLTLAVLAAVIVGCFFVLRPFLTALAWAAILCTTTWPLFKRLTVVLHGHVGYAALAMVLLLLLLMFAPFVIVGATIAENADKMAAWGRAALASGPPDPPAWLAGLPLIGPTVSEHWAGVAHDTAQFLQLLSSYLEPLRKFAIASGTSVVAGILQLALSIFIAWFMFRDGDAIVERLRGATRRIAG